MTRPDDDPMLCPEVSRWLSEGGADLRPSEPVTQIQVIEVLDFLASRIHGFPIATRRAAELAAAIRVRGLEASPGSRTKTS